MTAAFNEVYKKVLQDEKFGQTLDENPDEILKSFALDEAEITFLKSLRPTLRHTLRLREQTLKKPRRWYKPANFREAAAAVLSGFLLGLLVYAVWAAFSQVNEVPIMVEQGGNTQFIDPFDRAKELLDILFPLLGAVVTFWLGVTVEGRRADQNEADAKQARIEKDVEEGKKQVALAEAAKTRTEAIEILDEAEDAILTMGQDEEAGLESLAVGEGLGLAGRQRALDAIRTGRTRLIK